MTDIMEKRLDRVLADIEDYVMYSPSDKELEDKGHMTRAEMCNVEVASGGIIYIMDKDVRVLIEAIKDLRADVSRLDERRRILEKQIENIENFVWGEMA